jgi:putative ABC transport system permease protein
VDFRLPPLNGGERVYRALLCLYPARFRRAFAQDLVEIFRDQRRDAYRAGIPRGVFWFSVLRDLVTQALADRVASTWSILRRRPDPNREDFLMAGVQRALQLTELRYAIRRLLRAPSFTITTVFVLALGIGATTALFSVVNGVLLRPLPYPASNELVELTHSVDVSGKRSVDQSDASVLLYQEHARELSGIGAWRDRDVNLGLVDGESGEPERLSAAAVTANLFDVLKVSPLMGRTFEGGEDRVGAAPVVLVSYGFWQRHFHGESSVLGRRVVVDGVSREIVGVMPRTFVFPRTAPELWLPIALDPAHANAGSFNYHGVARLRNGATVTSARADLERVSPMLLEEFPSGIPPAMWQQAHVRPVVTPFRDAIVGGVSRLLWILLASATLVLMIACANVANLFLVRAESRQLELAVRSALGSGIAGIVAQSVSESLVLSMAGGVIGAGLAALGVSLATRFAADLGVPRLEQVSVDARVFGFAMALSVLCALLVSLIPVLRARRVPIASALRSSGRGSTDGAQRRRTRSILVVAQVALALMLVASSGLLARSFARLSNVEPGFNPVDVAMTRLVLSSERYRTSASRVRFYDRLLEVVRALPGVRAAALSDWVPLTDDHNDNVLSVEDHPLPPNAVPRVHFTPTVDPQYFKAMSIALLAGRTFEAPDPTKPSNEAVVSRAFAERYWPGGGALGKRVRPGLDGRWLTIVGVVSDVHYAALDAPADDAVYLPLSSADSGAVSAPRDAALLIRTVAGQESVERAVRSAVHTLDPSLPTYDERALTSVVSSASARARTMMILLALASVLALILGAVGIYGVTAYGVTLRHREIGVRIALGAQPVEVSRMIARQGIGLALTGVVIGTACALATTRLLTGMLYNVSPVDPLTFAATCTILLGVASFASWLPARRAAAIDPADTLRLG